MVISGELCSAIGISILEERNEQNMEDREDQEDRRKENKENRAKSFLSTLTGSCSIQNMSLLKITTNI